jgi:hypothetical protein
VKILIIGSGWVGCHLASKLRINHDVVIYEKNEKLFSETSYNNQNRLHIGYHYPRNSKTRELCRNTFSKFINQYGFLTKKIKNNVYCIPLKESLIDFETYSLIFKTGFSHTPFNSSLENMEGCISTEERYIDFKLASQYFNEELRDIHIKKHIKKKDIYKLKGQYDLILDCTNNSLPNQKKSNEFYELTVSYIYKNKIKPEFGALTLVDGKLFSIYPYYNDLFTVTDVELTVLKKFKSLDRLSEFKKKIDKKFLSEKVSLLEKKISFFYPNFLDEFEYQTFILSVKSKVENKSDDRSPVIKVEGNLLSIFTGKIQGIYIIEDFVDYFIKNENIDR